MALIDDRAADLAQRHIETLEVALIGKQEASGNLFGCVDRVDAREAQLVGITRAFAHRNDVELARAMQGGRDDVDM
ncbi:MAG: hypothetical protein V8R08_07275 [Coriobacteriales bacterium]